MCAGNNRATKYMKHKLAKLKRIQYLDKSILIVEVVHTLILVIDTITGQKNNYLRMK